MSNADLKTYLEGLGGVYETWSSNYDWVTRKSNPQTRQSMVPTDPYIQPETVRQICRALGVTPPPNLP